MSNYLTSKTSFKDVIKLQNPLVNSKNKVDLRRYLNEIEEQLLQIHEQLPQRSESVVLIYFSGRAKPLILGDKDSGPTMNAYKFQIVEQPLQDLEHKTITEQSNPCTKQAQKFDLPKTVGVKIFEMEVDHVTQFPSLGSQSSTTSGQSKESVASKNKAKASSKFTVSSKSKIINPLYIIMLMVKLNMKKKKGASGVKDVSDQPKQPKIIYKNGQRIFTEGENSSQLVQQCHSVEEARAKMIRAANLTLQLQVGEIVQEFSFNDLLKKIGRVPQDKDLDQFSFKVDLLNINQLEPELQRKSKSYSVIIIQDVIQEGIEIHGNFQHQGDHLTSESWMTKIKLKAAFYKQLLNLITPGTYDVRLLNKNAEIKDQDFQGKSQGSYLTEHLIAYLSGNMGEISKDQSQTSIDKAIATQIDPMFRSVQDFKQLVKLYYNYKVNYLRQK